MAQDKKQYNYIENVLQDINSKFVSLPEEEIRKNNKILGSLVTTIVEKMKSVDPLFEAMFSRVFYGGSYYDGLRVGHPTEFDLDLIMRLPILTEPCLTTTNISGFVQVKLLDYSAWMRQPESQPNYQTFKNLFDENFYLSALNVMAWMQGVITKTLNAFPSAPYFSSYQGYWIWCKRNDPALTVHLRGPHVDIDIDLVPSFEFFKDDWPKGGFKPNPFRSDEPNDSKNNFFIVPKQPKGISMEHIHRYWRLSFQEQERELINDKGMLKPAVRLLKKMRSSQKHDVIASYYIKTVALHMLEIRNDEFWESSLSYVFMTLLKEYKEYIDHKRISYYWHEENNLIGKLNPRTLEDISNRLAYIINQIETKTSEPSTIAKFALEPDEYTRYMMGRLYV